MPPSTFNEISIMILLNIIFYTMFETVFNKKDQYHRRNTHFFYLPFHFKKKQTVFDQTGVFQGQGNSADR